MNSRRPLEQMGGAYRCSVRQCSSRDSHFNARMLMCARLVFTGVCCSLQLPQRAHMLRCTAECFFVLGSPFFRFQRRNIGR